MKKIFNYIALATLTLSAVACSQEDLTSSYLSDSKAVHISAQVGENDVTGGFQTRSNPLGNTTEQAQFKTGDQISVVAGGQSAVTYTLGEDGSWMPETSKYLVWSSDNMNFTAYYPVGKNNASATTFTVPSSYDSEAALAEADYMTYTGSQSRTDGNGVTLPMERKMVRLIINTTFANQYESGYEVSSIKIHSNSTGYVDKDKVQSGNVEVTAYNNNGKFYALLAPTSADASAPFLTVTVNGISEDLTVKGIPATKAGYSYEMNLTVGKDKASVETVKITDWKNGTITGGEAIEDAKVDASTHTVYTHGGGQIKDDLLAQALGNESSLIITGPLSDADISTISSYIAKQENAVSLDMSKVEINSIPENAFYKNYKLGSVKLPTCIKSIGNSAFEQSCVTFENFEELIHLEKIGSYAFVQCRFANSIMIPESVSEIKTGAFVESNLQSITFPQSISNVEDIVHSCDNLESITFKGEVQSFDILNIVFIKKGCTIDFSATSTVPQQPTTGYAVNEFEGIYNSKTGKFDVTLKVKKGLKSEYEAHDWWKYFTIVEAE